MDDTLKAAIEGCSELFPGAQKVNVDIGVCLPASALPEELDQVICRVNQLTGTDYKYIPAAQVDGVCILSYMILQPIHLVSIVITPAQWAAYQQWKEVNPS